VDRLLVLLLRRYVRRGSFKVTTATGTTYTFGDGSGPPVAVRFTTKAAQCAALLDPELKLGETYMDGTLVVERGTIADVLEILLRQEPIVTPTWGLVRLLRSCSAAGSNSIRGRGPETMSPIITTSMAGFIRCFSTATSNTAALISRHPINRSTTPNWPKDATLPPNSA
jgi:cyclopropane-fatty-acyl-phospholipid synthase